MIDAIVRRRFLTASSTGGVLTIPGYTTLYTVEPPVNAPKHPAILPGTYDLTIRWSSRFKRTMPHVENVPGRSDILIHWGNWANDTEGCLLVGEGYYPDMVTHSVAAFDPLYNYLLANAEKQPDDVNGNPVWKCGTITYINENPPEQVNSSSGFVGGLDC